MLMLIDPVNEVVIMYQMNMGIIIVRAFSQNFGKSSVAKVIFLFKVSLEEELLLLFWVSL